MGELLVSSVWTLDVATRFLAGRHLIGGTEYMWDARWPLFTRLLSLHHVAFPILALWTLRRLGYDRRGIALQSAIAAVAVSLGRLFGPEANINRLHRSFPRSGPARPIAVVAGGLILVVYPLTHLLLSRAFRPSEGQDRHPAAPRCDGARRIWYRQAAVTILAQRGGPRGLRMTVDTE